MGDKRDRHPGMDGLICIVELPRMTVGAGGEEKSARDRQQEGEPNNQRVPPRFSHASI